MAMGRQGLALLLVFLATSIVMVRCEEDSGMCTMETKSTCADDVEEGGGDGPAADHYSAEANEPLNDEEVGDNAGDVGDTEQLPMSTMRDKPQSQTKAEPKPYWEGRPDLHIACVVCNDRAPEALIMMKSAVMFSTSPLTLHIFTEKNLRSVMSSVLDSWEDVAKQRVDFKFYPVKYPSGEDSTRWRENFKPCATMRLFIPTTTKIDSVIYMDTDTLFVEPVEHLWEHFSKFNSTQLAAVTPETEDIINGWYNRFARHPYYGEAGINSGVMLMNLTRMRAVAEGNWNKEMTEIFLTYYYNITWGDQDILNVYFHRHPERLYVYPCHWNFRPDHCMYGVNNCQLSNTKTPKVLHGSRQAFHNDKEFFFRAVYDAFEAVPASNRIKIVDFVESLRKSIDKTAGDAGCLVVKDFVLDSVQQAIMNQFERTHPSQN